jgi:hypothetical protein
VGLETDFWNHRCHNRLILLSIPLVLSFFVHLWNPLGFPSPDYDEGIYMRRAMNVLEGQGAQEFIDSFALYDHPYFGQLFLSAALAIIGFPDSLNPTTTSIHSVEILYLAPKILLALLAVIDTFLLYKIAERQYNSIRIALIGSILFAVMPITWLLREIWLEPIQLPLVLCSIFFAISVKRYKSTTINFGNKDVIDKRVFVLIILSGIFLGLAIFTKVPAFTMIPLVVFVILINSNRSVKAVRIWILPVLIIPLIWPAYSIISGQFSSWLHGIYFQGTRDGLSLFDSIRYTLIIDPFMMAIGITGILYSAIKRDFFILLWIVPFLIMLNFIGTTAYFHLIPILPPLCIGSARLIDSLLGRVSNKRIQKFVSFATVIILAGFGSVVTTSIISQDVNSHLIEASFFISNYLLENAKNNILDPITVISNPFYLWIPQYIFDLEDYFVPYYTVVSFKTDKLLLVNDTSFVNALASDPLLFKISGLLEKRGLEVKEFRNEGGNNSRVTLLSTNFSQVINQQIDTLNLLDDNQTWKSFGNANIIQDKSSDTLHIRVHNSTIANPNERYSGASLLTGVNLSQRPLLLSLEYMSKSSRENPTFYAEITENKENGKTVKEYILNTLYSEITESENENEMNALDDILNDLRDEIRKNSSGMILWNDVLENTNGNFTQETFVFPRLGSAANNLNGKNTNIEFRLYSIQEVPGEHELILRKALIT